MEMRGGAAGKAGASSGGATAAAAAAGEYWSEALKSFLDHIPVSGALPPSPSPALELNLDGCVWDAIGSMYRSNVAGAVIVDNVRTSFVKFVDRDIGFLEFSSLVLWALEELDKVGTGREDESSEFLSSLKQHRQIAETKIAWLAKLFLWEPFLPVRSHDTLFHAMLLFSKHHRLNVVPVVESMNSSVIGFVTQNAVLELLLQSSGLEWLDKIADKQLSEFRFVNASKPVSMHSDQTVADALQFLSKEKTGAAVIDRKTRSLIGSIQCSDLYMLLDDSSLFRNRKTLTAEEFVQLKNKGDDGSTEHSSASESRSNLGLRNGVQGRTCLLATNRKSDTLTLTAEEFVQLKNKGDDGSTEHSSASESRSNLGLRNGVQGRTCLPATNRKSDTLKQAIENLTASGSSCSFIVDEHGHVEGVVTARDIISVFSPPCMDSRIDGGTFFSAALEQAGCRVEHGQMIRNS